MNSLHLIFGILALVCFILDAAGVVVGRLNLVSTGLAFLTAAVLFV
jgi:hypothetical protein